MHDETVLQSQVSELFYSPIARAGLFFLSDKEAEEKLGEIIRYRDSSHAKESAMVTPHLDLNRLIDQLVTTGQTVTYHCCHCGTTLKIGSGAPQPLKTCPACGYDLQIINLEGLIRLHM